MDHQTDDAKAQFYTFAQPGTDQQRVWFGQLTSRLLLLEQYAAEGATDIQITFDGARDLGVIQDQRVASFDMTVAAADHRTTYTFLVSDTVGQAKILPRFLAFPPEDFHAPHTEITGSAPGYFLAIPESGYYQMLVSDLRQNLMRDYADNTLDRLMLNSSPPRGSLGPH